MTILADIADVQVTERPRNRLVGPRETPSPTADRSRSEQSLTCPACGLPAEVEWRDLVAGTSGPVMHVKIRCPQGRHWFLTLEESL